MAQPELPWVADARSWVGTAEIKGIKHDPKIVGIWGDTTRPVQAPAPSPTAPPPD